MSCTPLSVILAQCAITVGVIEPMKVPQAEYTLHWAQTILQLDINIFNYKNKKHPLFWYMMDFVYVKYSMGNTGLFLKIENAYKVSKNGSEGKS